MNPKNKLIVLIYPSFFMGLTVLFSLAVLFFSITLLKIHNFDFFWHLRTGDFMLSTLNFPQTDMFSYTREGAPWINSHILFQLLISLVNAAAGLKGLSIFLSLTLLLAFTLGLSKVPKNTMTSLMLLLALLCLSRRIMLRPEILTYLALSLYLLILEKPLTLSSLFFIACLQLLFANSHSLFLLGPVILSFYFFQCLLRKTNRLPAFSALLISLGACLITPYGIRGVLYPFLLIPQVTHAGNIFKDSIYEFAPLPPPSSDTIHLYLYLFLTAMVLIYSFYKKNWFEGLLLLFFSLLAIRAQRNFNLLIFVSLPVICRSQLLNALNTRLSLPLKKGLLFCLSFFSLGYSLLFFSDRIYRNENRLERFGLGFNESVFSRELAPFLNSLPSDTKIFNSMSLGGYLIYHCPNIKIFYDGRLDVYGPDFHREYLRMTSDIPFFLERAKQWGINTIVLNHSIHEASALMKLSNNANWRVVYLDYHAVVFLKNNFLPEIPALTDEALPPLVEKLKGRIHNEPAAEQELKNNILKIALKDLKIGSYEGDSSGQKK